MWDYDKLFAEGNVVGLKYKETNTIISVDTYNLKDALFKYYQNNLLESSNQQIQYIIRLDEHGNVVEKLFDREKNMPKPMPKLETGMFVRVEDEGLGYVDTINNRIVYQLRGYDDINGEFGIISDIIEVYGKESCSFDGCMVDEPIWRSPDYQTYLDSKSK